MKYSASLKAQSGPVITGRCFCGATQISTTKVPLVIAYCHCSDCRRVTGGPVAAFAAFEASAVTFEPSIGTEYSPSAGVTRSFCPKCGSPLSGRYDYLPGQIYIPLGVLDQIEELQPELHAHYGERPSWLHIEDDAERFTSSSRTRLNSPSDDQS